MKTLYNLIGEDFKNVLDANPFIEKLDDLEIENNINFLKEVDCSYEQMKNIIIFNPWLFNRSYDELNKLKNKLISIGITNLNITFDTQPLLLNKEIFEIDDFINEQIKKGLEINEIADIIDSGCVEW
ncbi:MAG: hypothetical protein KIC82_03385 [Acholeplasma sp.]|nr:hypothetical protein [Acholeplasma sp.]